MSHQNLHMCTPFSVLVVLVRWAHVLEPCTNSKGLQWSIDFSLRSEIEYKNWQIVVWNNVGVSRLEPHPSPPSPTKNFGVYSIRPIRLKFELTNQDSAGGKNCTVQTSNASQALKPEKGFSVAAACNIHKKGYIIVETTSDSTKIKGKIRHPSVTPRFQFYVNVRQLALPSFSPGKKIVIAF